MLLPTLDVEFLHGKTKERYLKRWRAAYLELANDSVRPPSFDAMRERYAFGLCTIEELEAAAALDAQLARRG